MTPLAPSPRRRITAVLFFLLVAATAALPDRDPAGAGDDLPPGVMTGWHEKSDDLDTLHASEVALGKKFAIVRLYEQWQMPSKTLDQVLAEGRLPLVSQKPPPTIGWLQIGLGLEDAFIHQLANKYKSYGRPVVFIFHHEPHDDAIDLKGGESGLSHNFVAAYRHIHDVFVAEGAHRSAGGNVWFGYTATTPWILQGDPPGSGDPLYPGDRYVDVLAHDRYNWASCRGDAWEEFADNWGPVVKLAAQHQKPLILGEFGSAPENGRRNEWFRQAAAWMKSDPDARRWLIGFAYYHSARPNCQWDFLNQGDDGRLGWTDAFTNDPHFRGDPFPLPKPTMAAGQPNPIDIPLPLPRPDLPPVPVPLPPIPG